MSLFVVPAIAVAVLILFGAFAALRYDSFVRSIRKVSSSALPKAEGHTELDRHWQSLRSVQKAENGLVLLTSNLDAFAARAMTARAAGRSLDLMYYMWNADLTGRLLMREVIAAADRGVRVRLLLDDMGVSLSDRIYHAIDCHPNIELRLFNPTKARENIVHRGIEMVLRFRSVNRRMHNKAWIADGRVLLVGGRNVGDAYYDAAEHANFRDFDLLGVGQAVAQTEQIFDDYWNSSVALPVRALLSRRANRLDRLRRSGETLAKSDQARPYLQRVHDESSIESLLNSEEIFWIDKVDVFADPPEKAAGKFRKGQNMLMETLLPILTGSQTVLNLTSPYFVPGARGVEAFTKLAKQGVKVSVLTNSLAATDVAAVHAGYARYRKSLMSGGVKLFELRSIAQKTAFSVRGSSQASLHTKAFTRDDRYGFVGSLNLDPRSVSLNTEMGILFECPELVRAMNDVFKIEISPDVSYAVALNERGALCWTGISDGETTTTRREPDASVSRRLTAWAVGLLPLESQL